MGIAGGLIGGAFSIGAAALSAKATRDLAREQMAFQKMMYETRYQMTVADLQEAGINPILAAQIGAGSAPTGSARDINIPDPTSAVSEGAQMPSKVKLLKEEIKLKQELQKTEKEKQHSEESLRIFRVEQNRHSAISRDNMAESTNKTVAETKMINLDMPRATSAKEAESSAFGRSVRQLKTFLGR